MATNEQGKRGDVKAYDLYPSTISPLVTQEQLEKERNTLTELEFRQEYEGQFIEQVDTYLPLDLIMSCVKPELELLENGEDESSYYLGADFAKARDETEVRCLSAWMTDS